MQTLLNHNNQPATIVLPVRICNGVEVKDSKTWEQLTNSDKQNIAGAWIKDHVYCNVNQVMELLAQNYDHCDYNEYMLIAESQDYTNASESHINDLNIDELIGVIEDYDLDINTEKYYKDTLMLELVDQIDCTNFDKEVLHDTLTPYYELDDCENCTIEYLENKLKTLVNGNYDLWNFDELVSICVDLGINFDGYLKDYQSDLASLIIEELDLDQYGQDNALDPEYGQAYEFYSVSDHFVAMTQGDLSCSSDILGLSVWARFCTGQSIVLDHAVQLAAFKALSDCSYQ